MSDNAALLDALHAVEETNKAINTTPYCNTCAACEAGR